MTSPIDPIRRANQLRRARRARPEDAEASAETANLPVPVDAPRTLPPTAAATPAEAAFAAQLLGQDGERRGLRAGPAHIENAKSSYNKIEWSGAHDRRARKGRITKTEV